MTRLGQDGGLSQKSGGAGHGNAPAEPQEAVPVPRYMGAGQGLPQYETEFEPLAIRNGELSAVVIYKDAYRAEAMSLDQVYDRLGEDQGKAVGKYILEHQDDWEYPSEFYPDTRLAPVSGREPCGYHCGCLQERLARVSVRLKAYLKVHMALRGEHDAALIVCFVVSTYFMGMSDYALRLLVRGATNSGKTTLAHVMRKVCYRGNMSGDTTGPALFRLIDSCAGTFILDEVQDYTKSSWGDLKKILKNGITPGQTVKRTEYKRSGESYSRSYDVFAPIVFLHQAGGPPLPEEVVNRSVTLQLVEQPGADIPIDKDYAELDAIRDELHSVRCLFLADPANSGLLEVREEALSELQSRDGIEAGGRSYLFKSRDNMNTLYTADKMTGNGEEVVEDMGEMQARTKDMERDSEMGMLFRALAELVAARTAENPIWDVTNALASLCSLEVASAYSVELDMNGDLPANRKKVSTRTVFNMLVDSGFEMSRNRSDNRSYIDARGAEWVFCSLMRRYGTDEDARRFAPLCRSLAAPPSGTGADHDGASESQGTYKKADPEEGSETQPDTEDERALEGQDPDTEACE